MSNTWFRFKQFGIEQQACAMKVTTDACLLGAWTPIADSALTVLDIGTGTGLLALMLAQRAADISIDAVEYDMAAAAQAEQNIAASPWQERIKVVQGDIRMYASAKRYDLIICNPPFFSGSLLGKTHEKNIARHTISLSMTELAEAVKSNMATNGKFSLLLPIAEYQLWRVLAEKQGIFEERSLHIRHHLEAPVKRVLSISSFTPIHATESNTLCIMNADGNYSGEATKLLGNFYLNL